MDHCPGQLTAELHGCANTVEKTSQYLHHTNELAMCPLLAYLLPRSEHQVSVITNKFILSTSVHFTKRLIAFLDILLTEIAQPTINPDKNELVTI